MVFMNIHLFRDICVLICHVRAHAHVYVWCVCGGGVILPEAREILYVLCKWHSHNFEVTIMSAQNQTQVLWKSSMHCWLIHFFSSLKLSTLQTKRFFYRYVILILIKLSAHILWIVFQVKSVIQLEWFYDDEIFISIIKLVDGNFLEVQFRNMWEHSVFYLSRSYSYNCFKLGKHVHETFCQLCAVHSYP